MICQIAKVKTHKEPRPKTKTELVLSAALAPAESLEKEDPFWAPILSGPFLVPVSRWVE